MGTTTTKPTTRACYHEDFVAWAAETAQLLLERRFDEIDIDSLAEEVQAMAARDRRELRSRVAVVLLHLLKWKYQPEKRSGSWQSIMGTQRRELRYLLQQSPSLKREVAEAVKVTYRDAVGGAAKETGLRVTTFPSDCPFSPEQILDPDYEPE